MKTGVTAFKLALAGFIVPYVYVYNPMLLFVDAVPLEMCQAIISALVGVFLLAMFSIGFFQAPMAWYMRILAFVGAIGLLIPGTMTDLGGLALLAVIYFIQSMKKKRIEVSSGLSQQ